MNRIRDADTPRRRDRFRRGMTIALMTILSVVLLSTIGTFGYALRR